MLSGNKHYRILTSNTTIELHVSIKQKREGANEIKREETDISLHGLL